MNIFFKVLILIASTSVLQAQYKFNKVFPSPALPRYTVDATSTPLIELKDGCVLFVSRATALDNSNYLYTYCTKLDPNGNVIWVKPITDSVDYVYARDFQKWGNDKYIICGSKYTSDKKYQSYWYGIFDLNMELIESHLYPTSYNRPTFMKMLQSPNGDIIFCGTNDQTDDRGNGASAYAKASVMCVDSSGNQKWYHEFWDSIPSYELDNFLNLSFDSQGNTYACGKSFWVGNGGNNDDGIIAKFDGEGKVLWYKRYDELKDAQLFWYITERKNEGMTLIGNSTSEQFTEPKYVRISFYRIDYDGNIKLIKNHPKTYQSGVRCFLELSDGNFVCGGFRQDSIEQKFADGGIYKFSRDGDIIWSRRIDNSDYESEYFSSISLSHDGGFFLGGQSWLPGIRANRSWVVKTDSSGCDATSCIETGSNDAENETNHYKVYPNPAKDQVTIEILTNINMPSQIVFYNINGQEVLEQNINTQKNIINVKDLASGIYVYQIRDSKRNVFNGKMVIR
ncbi:MAG: T9SS type A sorting domain-containing protein [Saprospiraceae bacterium]|nr:T9SS type A sorting domain-containing protein [Saprospiraceae bacterium]